jgi:hypothetical protein
VTKNVAFYSREYVLEYLSKGICLYGSNPFVDLYKNVTHEQYKNSIFIRTVYHVQTVRKVYLSQINTFEYKLNYLKKYIQRIGKNILMFMGLAEYDSLEKVSAEFLLSELIKHKLIKSAETEGFNDLKPLEYYYNIFTDLSNNLPELRKNIRVDTESL